VSIINSKKNNKKNTPMDINSTKKEKLLLPISIELRYLWMDIRFFF